MVKCDYEVEWEQAIKRVREYESLLTEKDRKIERLRKDFCDKGVEYISLRYDLKALRDEVQAKYDNGDRNLGEWIYKLTALLGDGKDRNCWQISEGGWVRLNQPNGIIVGACGKCGALIYQVDPFGDQALRIYPSAPIFTCDCIVKKSVRELGYKIKEGS